MTAKRPTLSILSTIILFWLCANAPAQEATNRVTNADFQRIAKKYLEAWGAGPGAPFIWVIVAMPNASVPLNIPGVAFGDEGLPVAGLTREVHGYMIVVNGKMAPEIALTSFLHELGHATYMRAHPNGAEAGAAESAAILFLLEALGNERLDELAYSEARVYGDMAAAEPYKSAVAQIAENPIWKRYSSPARP
jgi:hypothetical protein